jgi:chemotaxis signal transduction protein
MTEQASIFERAARERREIVVVHAGEHCLGLFAEEVACVEKGRAPTPLPHAPAAVLGVVSLRGRILTLLDPLALLCERREDMSINSSPDFILVLRGDEQLALAVDSSERLLEICDDEIEFGVREEAALARGTFQDEGKCVIILDVNRLFDAAVGEMGRRRRKRIMEDER